MSNFPTSIDSYTDPTATSKLNSPSHSQQHIGVNDAIEKIEAKVGADSSAVTSSHDYKLSGVTGTDKAVSKAGTETLTNKTLTAPTVTSPTTTGADAGAETLTNKRIVQTVTALTPAAAATQNLDLTLGNIFKVTMPAGALTLTVSNELVGQFFSVEIVNATSQTTLTWFSTIKWIDGVEPTLTGTNTKKDTFVFEVTSADNYDGYIAGQNI